MLKITSLLGAAAVLSACVIVVDGSPDDAVQVETSFTTSQSRAAPDEVLPAEATLEPFTKIHASSGTTVIVRQGEQHTIRLDDDARRRSSYAVEDGALEVRCRQSGSVRTYCMRGDRGTVIVTVPTLEEMRSSSGASLRIEEGVPFGASVTTSASSGASLSVRGEADVRSLSARSSSGASLDARGITAEEATAKASSGASLRLGTVEGRLDAKASSGASITYRGEPSGDRKASSGGSVSRR